MSKTEWYPNPAFTLSAADTWDNASDTWDNVHETWDSGTPSLIAPETTSWTPVTP